MSANDMDSQPACSAGRTHYAKTPRDELEIAEIQTDADRQAIDLVLAVLMKCARPLAMEIVRTEHTDCLRIEIRKLASDEGLILLQRLRRIKQVQSARLIPRPRDEDRCLASKL